MAMIASRAPIVASEKITHFRTARRLRTRLFTCSRGAGEVAGTREACRRSTFLIVSSSMGIRPLNGGSVRSVDA